MELLCVRGKCTPLHKTHQYLPPARSLQTAAVRAPYVSRLLDEMKALQFPADKATCAREGRISAAYNAGLASTYHGMMLQFKRALRDRVPLHLGLAGYKRLKTRSGRRPFIPRGV